MAFSELNELNSSEENDPEKLKTLLGPGAIENGLRQSIQVCWMFLPAEKRSVDEVERQVRRLIDRIFKNLRDDEQALFR